MSADNYGVIAQHPLTGRWHVLTGFASEDEFEPNVRGDGHETLEAAMAAADRDYFEYGWHRDAWPEQWQEFCGHCGGWAERWLDDDKRVHGMLGVISP